MEFRINNKVVGYVHPCFIIAEAGVNHNGKIELARRLIDVAAEAGADAVKFQTFRTENLVTEKAEMAEYQKKKVMKAVRQKDLLEKLELNHKDFEKLKEHCDRKGIIFLSTPHTPDAVEFLDRLVPAFKIGSGDLNNLPMLETIAKLGKPMILGTGMGTMEEVREALASINRMGNEKVVMLHCTTSYPCALEDVNLNAMLTMKKDLRCLVGYSDHTLGTDVSVIAANLGAAVIEKHFTLDKDLPGPDHKASLEPTELKRLVDLIRTSKKIASIKEIMGNPNKNPTPGEIRIMAIVRKSVIADKDISKGQKILREDLIIKRPGTGLKPSMLNYFIGKKAAREIKKDSLMEMEMV